MEKHEIFLQEQIIIKYETFGECEFPRKARCVENWFLQTPVFKYKIIRPELEAGSLRKGIPAACCVHDLSHCGYIQLQLVA